MNVVLAVDGPLDVTTTLARYRLWGEDPANRLVGESFLRVLRFDGRLWPYEVRWTGPVNAVRLEIRIPGARAARVTAAAVGHVRRVFGLDVDLAGFYRHAAGDAVLAPLVNRLYGLRPTLTPTALEMLVGAITAQQVNLTFAFTLRARLVRRYGAATTLGGETIYAFPEAARLGAARLRELRAMQFSTRKAEYIRDVARAAAAGRLDLDVMAKAPNEAVIATLTSMRGLGRWSADWFLARCLGRGDVCPAGDLAVRKIFEGLYGRGRRMSEAAIRRRARAWGPYQSLALHYLLVGSRLADPVPGGGT